MIDKNVFDAIPKNCIMIAKGEGSDIYVSTLDSMDEAEDNPEATNSELLSIIVGDASYYNGNNTEVIYYDGTKLATLSQLTFD